VTETSDTIKQIHAKAADHDSDLPPEVLEALVASMMSEGERQVDGLWARLLEMLNSVELASPDPEELEESVKTFFYKEWDEELSDYKMDWTLVRQRLTKDDPNPFVEDISNRLHGLITLIRRQFTRLKPERFKRFRAQPIGDDLDIDALVQAFVDMQSNSFLSENVYIRRDKRIRDVAVLFLLDMSGSTEELVNGRRVIDIEKEAMALMAEALDSLGDTFAIFGFSSEGRFRVDLFTVKEFGEDYGERAQYRLGNLEPRELTRLGAVIRHGIYKLESTLATVKLMVILTDGRPYDLDYGSMDYALADTRKALQEARKKRIHPFIITSDKKGASYLRKISPQTQSIILNNVELLPAMLPALYKRLTI
jgi:nitric oxide reductase NorD protein